MTVNRSQNELDFFRKIRNTTSYDATIVEVGVHTGIVSNVLKGGRRTIYSIDTWTDDVYDTDGGLISSNVKEGGWREIYRQFCVNCEDDLYRSIIPIRADSELVASTWQIPLDLVYLDAAHDYENVKKDILNWWPKLKNYGIMLGDDYDPAGAWGGVVKAVDEIFPNRTVPFANKWMVQKIGENIVDFNRYINHTETVIL